MESVITLPKIKNPRTINPPRRVSNAWTKIAIIGGGASGVSVLNELVHQLIETGNSEEFEITLYEQYLRQKMFENLR